jgi:steroid delta-isomerase-like uncharacterized protein
MIDGVRSTRDANETTMPEQPIDRRDILKAALVAPWTQGFFGRPGLKELFGHYADCVNRRDAMSIGLLFADQASYLDITFGVKLLGRAAIRNMFWRGFAAIRGGPFLVETVAFDHNTIAVRWEAHGRHDGPMLGVPPSGRQIEMKGASFLTVADSLIEEQIDFIDRAGLERQLGVRGASRE